MVQLCVESKISLTWDNISVEFAQKQHKFFSCNAASQKNIVLDNGYACSYSFTAIMGASGAGKTTFLGAVSGRLKGRTGSIKLNGNPATDKMIRNMSGYIQQQDIFTETLTCYEYLRFMAALKLFDMSANYRREVITKLITELGLTRCSSNVIRNMSGGERRRLSLAAELISDPYILFCDEPTTGLDSYSAITIIQKLQNIAASGKIVLVTIHQPSSQLFNHFNNLMLLSEGKLAFQGSKKDAGAFFDSLGMFCPETYNPADFYIKCLTNPENSPMICSKFRLKVLSDFKQIWHSGSDIDKKMFSKKKKKPLLWDLRWLMWRSCIDSRRNFSHNIMGYIFLMITGLTLAISFAYVKVTDRNSVQNIQGILFFMTSELIFANMYAVIYVFPGEMAVFLKEKSLYSCFPYFLSKLLSMIPYCFLCSISYVAVFFLIVQFLRGFHLLVNMFYVLFCTTLASAGLGLAFSATFSSVEYIDLIMGPLELGLMLLSGLWIRIETLSPFVGWIRYLSPFFLAFESLSTLHWRDVTEMGFCHKNSTTTCFENGREVLGAYGFLKNYDAVLSDIFYLNALIALYSLIGFAGIIRRKFVHSSY